MKIFGLISLSVMEACKDHKENKKPIGLTKEGTKIFEDVEQILGGMANLFNGLDKIGKSDYGDNAADMMKWQEKIKAQFITRMTKCGSDYYDADKKFE